MNQYEDFHAFMLSVINLSEKKHPNSFQNKEVMKNVKMTLGEGWEYFVSITSVIDRSELTEKDYSMLASNTWLTRITLGLGAALPIGGSALVMNLQKHREIPVAIKNVGLKFRKLFEEHVGEQMYLDVLMEETAENLIMELKLLR